MQKDEKEKVYKYPETIDTRVALLEQCVSNINETLKDLRTELKEMRSDLNGFKTDMHNGFTGMRTEMKSDFRWMLVTFVGLFGSLTGVVAKGLHWF
jgi:hypothetical protein